MGRFFRGKEEYDYAYEEEAAATERSYMRAGVESVGLFLLSGVIASYFCENPVSFYAGLLGILSGLTGGIVTENKLEGRRTTREAVASA